MSSLLAAIPLLAPLAFAAVAFLASRHPGARPRGVERATGWAAVVGLLTAFVSAGLVAGFGTMTTPLLGIEGLGLALRLDALSVSIFVMVALLSVVILRFSVSYLDGDARQGIFLGRMSMTIAWVEILVLSGNLGSFVLAWIATSLSLHGLLIFYAERPSAVNAARKKFFAARLGDACLIGAAALLYVRFETGDLGTIFDMARVAEADITIEAAAVLLAMAALFKAAQFPTHGWLVEVMETPTPVSALLHAGILNAGPFLVLRFASIVTLGTVSQVCLVLAGGFTALFASVVLLTQPSVKVALGYSSAAHMGFMLLVCGLGVYPAAVLHLVAHSFYKAHAFLSSGSVVDEARAAAVAVPARLKSPLRLVVSLVVAVGLYLGLAAMVGFTPLKDPALLAVGAILVMGLTQLLATAFDSTATTMGLLRTSMAAASVTLAFFALEEGVRWLLMGALPPMTPPTTIVLSLTILVLFAFALAIAIQLVGLREDSMLRQRAYVLTRNGLYANAMLDRWVGAYRI